MDFLKTLLLYMTVTMATAVQGGPLPEDVPTPTAAPTVLVAQETPGLQVEVETPAPAATVEALPTLTPNKAYKNIEYGDRGNDVKKMQERLIELGYLPEGSADGAFGYQTNNAVKAFQGANGLNRDGVAGPATLTRLYEDPNVVAQKTATPEPTGTPAPETEPNEPGSIALPEDAETDEPSDDLTMADAPKAEAPAEQADEQAESAVPGLTQMADASIVLGDSGSRLAALRLSDGVMVPFYPRVWLNGEGAAVVSLRDMADSISVWILSIEENVYTLEAAGYVVELTVTEEGVTCAVDGEAIELETGEAVTDGQDIYVTENFLRDALGANVVWDEDEHTLMLNIPEKDAAQTSD